MWGEEIPESFIVDLDKTAAEHPLATGQALEHIGSGIVDQALSALAAENRVCLPGACVPIGKDCYVETSEALIDQRLSLLLEEEAGVSLRSDDLVKFQ